MTQHRITHFAPHPFKTGDKLHIDDGPRRGDWEVADVTERKVTLRCPVSGREFTWDRFCYVTEVIESDVWPSPD